MPFPQWPTPRWNKNDKLYWKHFSSTHGDKIIPVELVWISVHGSGEPKTEDDYVYTVKVLPNPHGLTGEHWISYRERDHVYKTQEEAEAATPTWAKL